MNFHPTQVDAWAFARLRVGHTLLPDEVDAVSGPYRLVARAMSRADAQGRERIWRETTEGLGEDESRTLVEAVAEVDPREDRPDEGDGPEEWPPLRLGKLPPVDPFPLDVFPEPIARLAVEAATSIGCDVGFVGGSILAIAGGLIGRSSHLLMKNHFYASSSLFVANVGQPGDGKTPALKYASKPVAEIDRVLAEEFAKEKERFREESRRPAKDERASTPPVPRRVVVEDTTLESLSRTLAANGRGVVQVLDELAVLICGLGQYKSGRGNDRANLLKMWAGAPIVIDRVQNEFSEPIRIPHPCLSIVGNLPPSTLVSMTGGQVDDGMIDRWLFVYPDRLPKLKGRERGSVSDEAIEDWKRIADVLWRRQLDIQGGWACPHVIGFSDDGRSEFDHWDDLHVDEFNSHELPDQLHGPWSKLQEYAGRLCLVLTLLRRAAVAVSEADLDLLPLAGPAEARDAWRLVAYFKSHHKRVRAYLQGKGLGGAPEGSRLILNWIRNNPGRDYFSGRDIARTYPPSRGYDRAMMEDGLAWLVGRNAIRQAAAVERPQGSAGRKASPRWLIHPELFCAQQNQQRQQNDGDSADDAVSAAPREIRRSGA